MRRCARHHRGPSSRVARDDGGGVRADRPCAASRAECASRRTSTRSRTRLRSDRWHRRRCARRGRAPARELRASPAERDGAASECHARRDASGEDHREEDRFIAVPRARISTTTAGTTFCVPEYGPSARSRPASGAEDGEDCDDGAGVAIPEQRVAHLRARGPTERTPESTDEDPLALRAGGERSSRSGRWDRSSARDSHSARGSRPW